MQAAATNDRYKWIALSNATLAVLLASLDGSITIIAMPDIFRGIHLDPLVPANSFYLLWMILGYLVVTSVLIVSLGRLGDMVGRVRIYNLGFVIYTVASLLLAIDWMTGRSGATYLIGFRIIQGIGGACRLRLHRDTVLGRHLHAPADDRDAGRRPHLGLPVRPLRRGPFATAGMVLTAAGFGLLLLLLTNFTYPAFGAILALIGIAMGLFASPNRAAVMNSLPPEHRGAGGAMTQTFQNSAQVLSVGVFFTLMVIGLSATLPHTLATGLQANGVPAATAHTVSQLPPVSILFAAFLGYNPVQHLAGSHVLAGLPHHSQAMLSGHTFFPALISAPFRDGLHAAFLFAMVACLIAAAASAMRGGRTPRASSSPRSSMVLSCTERLRPSSREATGAQQARAGDRQRPSDARLKPRRRRLQRNPEGWLGGRRSALVRERSRPRVRTRDMSRG